jgi:hypothetical protein
MDSLPLVGRVGVGRLRSHFVSGRVTSKSHIDVSLPHPNLPSMDRKATTFRIDPVVRDGLFKLSELLHRPANQLAKDALKEYVDRRIGEVEDDLESTLEDLRAYRKSDPNFDRAIAEVVEAEVNLKNDPAEGKLIKPKSRTRKRARVSRRMYRDAIRR